MRIIKSIKRKIVKFLVNKVLDGTNPRFFPIKAKLLRSIGYVIGNNVSIVGPVICTGKLEVGDNSWVGTNLVIRGNGTVKIGHNVDIGPDVTFLTGTHEIGNENRRAGKGCNSTITIGDGCWVGAKSVFLNTITIGRSTIIAACSCVNKDASDNVLIGGVPARIIRVLD